MTSLSNVAPDAGASPYIKEVTVQNFMAEVIQASLQLPVLVYFTAAWCGPCKQYGPTLEKVVNDAKGRVKLARVDIDKNPQLAQQFRIQSVPMVYIFFQGQPLDGFAGAMQESQLKQMLAQLPGGTPEAEAAKATLESAAQLLAEGMVDDAEQAYQMVLAEDKNNIEAIAGLAKCFVAQGHLAKAEQLLGQVPEDKQSHESVAAARAAFTLAKSVPQTANEAALRKAVTINPLDHQARYDLAGLLFAGGKQEEAIGELLAVIARNKDWNEGAARKQLLTFFEALGHTHPLTMQGRRKLSSILF
jgi:putative thioredoxin